MLGGGLADVLFLAVGRDVVIVEAAAPGLTREVVTNLDPTRRVAKVNVDGLEVDDADVVLGGAAIATSVARTLAAAEAAGGAYACVEMATEYAKVRQQFGRPIGTYQAVKHHCANMLVGAELAIAAVWDAARVAPTSGDEFELVAAVAATQAFPAFLQNAQLNIQVHGGIGYTWEHDAHMFLRRAGALAAMFGTYHAAADVSRLAAAGTERGFGLDLPPEAEVVRQEVRTRSPSGCGCCRPRNNAGSSSIRATSSRTGQSPGDAPPVRSSSS